MNDEKYLVCIKCSSVYEYSLFDYKEYSKSFYCPDGTCCGKIVEKDKNIIDTVRTLNIKGYFVNDFYANNLFMFIKFTENYMFETLPEGFEICEVDVSPEVVFGIPPKETHYYLTPKNEKSYASKEEKRELLKWAESLPPNETLSETA